MAVGQVHHRLGAALGHGLAVPHDNNVLCQARHLFNGVRNKDNRNAEFLVQLFDVGKYFALALHIQAGKRFIHENQAGGGEQGPADGHALALAA